MSGAEGRDDRRRNGGVHAEEERAELNQKFNEMYTNNKQELLDTITELMGDGHTGGSKATLIERVVTASLMSKNAEEEADMELLEGEEHSDVEDFEEVEVESTCDFKAYQFAALKALRKGVFKLQKTVKKSGNASGHKLRYCSTRRYCQVCPVVNPAEDDEEQKSKSTFLVCMTCKVAVCTGAHCLMAHMCEGKGKPMTRKAWDNLEERADQGGHKEVPTRRVMTREICELSMYVNLIDILVSVAT